MRMVKSQKQKYKPLQAEAVVRRCSVKKVVLEIS